jgi:hypothetical protein
MVSLLLRIEFIIVPALASGLQRELSSWWQNPPVEKIEQQN